MSEEVLNAWCRERGFFTHDLTQWHSEFCEVTGTPARREDGEELRRLLRKRPVVAALPEVRL